jgi:hypothetical protein
MAGCTNVEDANVEDRRAASLFGQILPYKISHC